MKTAKEALCTHLNMDFADMSYYSYQPGRYTRTVYAFEDAYYCCAKDATKLPKPTRDQESRFNWVEVPDSFVNKYGWKIFKSLVVSE